MDTGFDLSYLYKNKAFDTDEARFSSNPQYKDSQIEEFEANRKTIFLFRNSIFAAPSKPTNDNDGHKTEV